MSTMLAALSLDYFFSKAVSAENGFGGMVFQGRTGRAPVFPRIQHLVSSDQVACVTQGISCVSGVLPVTFWEQNNGEGSS